MITEDFTTFETKQMYKEEIERIQKKIKFVLSQQITHKYLNKFLNKYYNNYDIITIHLTKLKDRLVNCTIKMDMLHN